MISLCHLCYWCYQPDTYHINLILRDEVEYFYWLLDLNYVALAALYLNVELMYISV